jgi:NRPS condensation-like uncharacterized protein
MAWKDVSPMAVVEIPFTGVEELLFLLDSPAEPQNQRLEVELPGTLDAGRLRTAVSEVVVRHPVLRARLRPWRPSDRKLVWEVGDELDEDPVVHRKLEGREELLEARDELLSRPFDLLRSPPLRLCALEHDGRTHVLLVIHHTALDGQALLTVLREIAAAYAGRPPVDHTVRVPASAVSHETTTLSHRLTAIGRIAAGALHRTARVAPDRANPSAPGCHLGGVRLDRERTSALDAKRLVPEAGATDLLLAGGILAIDRWNAAHGETGGRIALLHAVGLPAVEGRQQLSNSWMATVIGATPNQRRDPRGLIRWISTQRKRQAEDAQAAGLRAALGEGLPLPLWAKRAVAAIHPLTGHRLVETAALTNMGRLEPYDFGDGLRSDALWIDSAVRLPKGLFMGCAFHDGSLHVSLRSMRAQLGRDALQRLGDLYLETLLELG